MLITTSTFGTMESAEQQAEYLLAAAAVGCGVRGRGDWLAEVSSWFEPMYISDPHWRKVYTAVLAAHGSGAIVTDHELAGVIPRDGMSFPERASQFHGLVVDGTAHAPHIIHYAKQVYMNHVRANASDELHDTANEVAESKDPDGVLSRLPGIANKYAPAPQNVRRDNRSVMEQIIQELDGKTDSTAFKFGIEDLDNAIGGITPGDLITIAADTGHGKSVFMGQCAMRCIERYEKAVVYFALEMSVAAMYKRWASHLSRQAMRGGNTSQFIDGLARIERMEANGLLKCFPGAKTIDEIKTIATAYSQQCDLGMIVVDYLQIIESEFARESREREVSGNTMELKNLATRIGVPVFTGSQVNEHGQVRESRAIKQTSNVVLMLKPDTQERGAVVEMDIEIVKSRDSANDIAQVIWEKPLYTIRDKDVFDTPQELSAKALP